MLRLALALAVLPMACTMAADNRPKTLEYVTGTVLSPYCGSAQCHSTFTHSYGDVFDTVKGARHTIVVQGLAGLGDTKDASAAVIVAVVANEFGINPEIGRMPYDAPLPDDDINLLRAWVAAGAEGAQCDPDLSGGLACAGDVLYECGTDGNLSSKLADCGATGCTSGDANNPAAHCR